MSITVTEITGLYVGYFNRAPDPQGLNYWIARAGEGMSLADMANSFAGSSEAHDAYPFLLSQDMATVTKFLADVYHNLFDRDPDAGR